jgi:membrane protein DedA with SNARE-associated domain
MTDIDELNFPYNIGFILMQGVGSLIAILLFFVPIEYLISNSFKISKYIVILMIALFIAGFAIINAARLLNIKKVD